MREYAVAVVGVGAVGTEMMRLLKRRNFPVKAMKVLARRARVETIDGVARDVSVAEPTAFDGVDFAFFAGTEGEKGASQTLGWEAVRRGAVVIDNGDDFRMDAQTPLVIPEINPEALAAHKGLIANPNCSTIIALMALAPLHRAAGLRRLTACTYQAVSGTGAAAVTELERQTRAWAEGRSAETSVYPHPIAFNVLASVGSFKDDSGESSEEIKMRRETHKILGDDTIRIATTCARVPVFNGHCIAIHAAFDRPLLPEQARELLRASPGVEVVDDPSAARYPMPIAVSGSERVQVGRIRKDPTCENGLALWCAGDNIWKGAAQNAIQIAETLVARGNIKPRD